jgi:hypothetical protein
VILSQKKLIEDLMFQPKTGKLSSVAMVAPRAELGRTKYITEKEFTAISLVKHKDYQSLT